MAKNIKKVKYERLKQHCVIGTIGHVDHGKTTLTAAITKVLSQNVPETKFIDYMDIDRDSTERKRGITINATHIEYETLNRHYTHIDCPGHQDFIKNMIIGANQMDGVILVISIVDGPQEQTREHVILAKEIGIEQLVVYMNKLDMAVSVDETMLELVTMELEDFLFQYGYLVVKNKIPIIKGSARRALNEENFTQMGSGSIEELMAAVDTFIQPPKHDLTKPFLMPIEEAHSITGRGTVLTGKVERGRLTVGEDVSILGHKSYNTICIGLEMFHKVLDQALAGESIGVLVRSIPKKAVKRGYVLATPNSVTVTNDIIASVYLLSKDEGGRSKPINTGFQPQFFFRTSNITGKMIFDEDTSFASPGDDIKVRINLIENVALELQLRFSIREGNTTVGAGVITDFYNAETYSIYESSIIYDLRKRP